MADLGGLALVDNGNGDLRRVHVQVQLAADEKARRRCKARLRLEHLRRLLLHNEGAVQQPVQQRRELRQAVLRVGLGCRRKGRGADAGHVEGGEAKRKREM